MRFWLLLGLLATGTCPAQAVMPQVGCGAWHRASALRLEGTIEEGGLKGRFTLVLDPRDGRNSVTRDFGVFVGSTK